MSLDLSIYVVDIVPVQDQPYKHDVVLFDEYGLVYLRCHKCGQRIGGRTYVPMPSRSDPVKSVNAMTFIRYANYAERKIQLSDSSISWIYQCIDCVYSPIDLENVMPQIKHAWIKEDIAAGKSEEYITTHIANVAALTATKDTGEVNIPYPRRQPDAGR